MPQMHSPGFRGGLRVYRSPDRHGPFEFKGRTVGRGLLWRAAAVCLAASGLGSPFLAQSPKEPAIPSAPAAVGPCVDPFSFSINPASVTVAAGAHQRFAAAFCGRAGKAAHWTVNGVVGGNAATGTISSTGLYAAPPIDPGETVSISIKSGLAGSRASSASVTIANPELAPLKGATYAGTMDGWNASMLPWAESLSGLLWDPAGRQWSPMPAWTVPAEGIAPNIYYLEEALRPATRMAIVHKDIALIEELALFHTSLLKLRTTSIGAMLAAAPANSVLFIDGPSAARTFAWFEPLSAAQVRIRDCQTCNAQNLSTAARLLRAIAELPAADRTEPMLDFARQFTPFLVSEQLLRLMYGTTAWSHWDNPNIPQPVIAAWSFLASTGYEPPDPLRYQAAMTDMELWMVSSSAEVLAANQAAPELKLLQSADEAQLRQAVTAGVSLMQVRCHHAKAADGADVLSAFAGDYDDHPDFAYAGVTTGTQPSAPSPMRGLSWDISHSYRLPVIFRGLYETRGATGVSFPALSDLVALANSYVHQAFNGDAQLPAFNNYLDSWNGWYAVEAPDIPSGYPPFQFCQSHQAVINCMTPGTVQGWGELAVFNPSLAALSQKLVDLAYDDSAATAAFKDQHYFYAGQHYSASSGAYPLLMVYVAGDSAERLR